jgi:mediator of replication checkpoint protein 1
LYREIEKADDAKRQAAALGVTEGKHRTRRRHGKDFYSDDESDEEGGRRRLSKKARRARRMELRADGVAVLRESLSDNP